MLQQRDIARFLSLKRKHDLEYNTDNKMTAKIKKPLRSSSHSHPHKPKGLSLTSFEKIYWPFLPVILIIGFLSAVSFTSHTLPNTFRSPTSSVLSYATQMNIDDLLSSTNNMRSLNNIGSLKLSKTLDTAAQAKANDMATRNYWSHSTPEGNQPWVFVNDQNYAYQKLGENLAAGFIDSQSTIKGWMASASHRENLLDPSFDEVGFGFANNPDYTAGGGPMTIVVAFYARPSAAPAISDSSNPALNLEASLSAQPTTTSSAISQPSKTKITTRAQIAFFSILRANTATYFALILAGLAVGLWIGRHALAAHKAIKSGERFVVTHPFFDFSLLIIAGLSFLLTKTAGFIT